MAEFYKTSTIWVVDFHYDGRPRRWFKALDPNADVDELMATELRQLYGTRAQLVGTRKATDEEEMQYLRGDEPKNAYCPTARGGPRSGAC